MALALSTWLDVSSAKPHTDARLYLAVEIVATGEKAEARRGPSRTVLALDVSGSMQGDPLEHVVRSVDGLLDALAPEDELGVVAFSDGAAKVVDPVAVDAAGKRLVRSRVARLFASGQTNVEAGLELAASLLQEEPEASVARLGVVLLSDGAPNVGAHTAEALREVVRRHRPRVSFASLGYGIDHNEDVLSAVGDAGGGGYELVQDPVLSARAFARALGAQGDVVATGIELVLAPGELVELVRFVGRETVRFSRDGVVVTLADMVPGARRVVAAELALRAPGPERFVTEIARVELRHRAPGAGEVAAASATTTIEVAPREPERVVDAARRVLLARADEAREQARALADRGQFSGAAVSLRALLTEIERLPGWIANDGSPLAEAYELLVDEAMAMERRPSAEAYAAFRKAAVAERLAVSVPSAARSRGPASAKLIEHTSGDVPEAWLVVVGPTGDGARHRLGEECVIGRTADAAICVASPSVSRRHAEIYALHGSFWVADLGSTNPTSVNGRELTRAPRELRHGDVLRVGEVELRYEEGARKT